MRGDVYCIGRPSYRNLQPACLYRHEGQFRVCALVRSAIRSCCRNRAYQRSSMGVELVGRVVYPSPESGCGSGVSWSGQLWAMIACGGEEAEVPARRRAAAVPGARGLVFDERPRAQSTGEQRRTRDSTGQQPRDIALLRPGTRSHPRRLPSRQCGFDSRHSLRGTRHPLRGHGQVAGRLSRCEPSLSVPGRACQHQGLQGVVHERRHVLTQR